MSSKSSRSLVITYYVLFQLKFRCTIEREIRLQKAAIGAWFSKLLDLFRSFLYHYHDFMCVVVLHCWCVTYKCWMPVNTWTTGHVWHHLDVRTTATVPMERDQKHQENSRANVHLGIVDNSVKKVWLDINLYINHFVTHFCVLKLI